MSLMMTCQDAGSIPAASTMYQESATGTNASDSGFLLSEVGKPQEVTEFENDESGIESTLSGTRQTDTGTANPLPIADESANKSAARKIRTYSNEVTNPDSECTPEQIRELIESCPSLPPHIRAAILALLSTI